MGHKTHGYVAVAGVPPNLGNSKWSFFSWLASLAKHTSGSGSGVSLAIFRALSRKKHDEAHNNQHLLKYSNLFLKTQQPSYLSGVVHSACFSESWIQLLIKNFDSMLMLNINLIYRCQFIWELFTPQMICLLKLLLWDNWSNVIPFP